MKRNCPHCKTGYVAYVSVDGMYMKNDKGEEVLVEFENLKGSECRQCKEIWLEPEDFERQAPNLIPKDKDLTFGRLH